MEHYCVYVLQNENGIIYIGYTGDLEKRIKRHNQELPNKKTSFTSKQGEDNDTAIHVARRAGRDGPESRSRREAIEKFSREGVHKRFN